MRATGEARFSATWAAIEGVWGRRSREIGTALLVVVALVAVLPRLGGPVRWTPDGLFYQAHIFQVQGESQKAALKREFSSAAARSITRPDGRVGNPSWVRYSAQFYQRRWLVPLMAAVIYPIAGDRSLVYVSILGYVLAGLLLFALLRTRFSDAISVLVSVACLLLPPVRTFGGFPLTDSWGLALEIAALWAALVALERGGRWIAVWTVTMLALSFTRDATLIPLLGAAWIALLTRTRRSAGVLATGIAASLPALTVFGAPLRRQLAYVIAGFHIPATDSWSYVISHYPASLWSLVRQDLYYPRGLSYTVVWYLIGAALVAAVVYMFVAAPRGDAFFTLNRAGLIGAALIVAVSINYTDMRLELVFIPGVAAGLAFAVTRLSVPARAWLSGGVGARAAVQGHHRP